MNSNHIINYLYKFAGITSFSLLPFLGLAQTNSNAAKDAPQITERDGQHDFDPLFGSWKAHLKRRLHPLAGSNEWVELDATIVYKKIWDGRANYSEMESTSGSTHIEGVTVRTYNPQTHQWSLYWANSKDGILAPPQVGEFRNGRGEFFAEDTFNGKKILVRYLWSNLRSTPHYEQSFSDDGGVTWEVNWISDQTRIPDDSVKPVPPPADSDAANHSADSNSNEQMPEAAERSGQHDFDGLVGSWKYHLKRSQNPLTGSNTWVDLNGTGDCYKVWNGRANMDTFEADGTTGHIEGLTLRLYNPQTHEWRLYWANSRTGIIDPPQIGKFKNGHGQFYTQDTINNKTIFVKFDWTGLNSSSPHFEQSFSDDGGKTWEVNWITDQTRVSK
jgi:hypothetical protein